MTAEKLSEFYSDSEEELKRQGLDPNNEIPEGTEELHEKLKQMKEGSGIEISTEEIEEKEEEFSPEEWERMKKVASNMIESLAFDPEKETFLLIIDDKVWEENEILVKALHEELEKRTSKSDRTKGNYKIMGAKASPVSATPFGDYIGDQMKDRPVLILTSMSRSHSKETGAAARGDIADKEKYTDILKRMGQNNDVITRIDTKKLLEDDKYYEGLKRLARDKRARIISCTKGTNPFEILTKGAVEESPEVLKEKTEKVAELMKDVIETHVTTSDGTDLTFKPRVDKEEMETGQLDEPGDLSNYPVGEWSCSVFWEGANGTLVVSGPFGGKNKETGRWHNLDWVKEEGPMKLDIEEGEVTGINGKKVEEQRSNPDNDLIKSFIAYLDAGNNDQNHAYKLAELGVGVNTKACQDKPDEYWGSTETEKKYGTVHIAVGSNGTFGIERDDPNFSAASVHCDMILIDKGLTVECIKEDGSKFNLIEKGKPIGY